MTCKHRPTGVSKTPVGDCSISSELRHRIIIQTVTESSDSMGGYTESWATYASAWARIIPKLGNERFFASKTQEDVSHYITIRYITGVTPKMRISFDGRIFQIRSVVSPLENKQWLDIFAMEGPAT